MALDVATFRAQFPEFGSSADFTNDQVQFWLTNAYRFINADRWGSSTDMGASLFAAHNLVLEARAQKEAAAGGIPGAATGMVSSKSVGGVSLGYDTSSVAEENGGHWNLTVYGQRYLRFAKMFGIGPVVVNYVGSDPMNGPAWPGPNTTPSMTGFGN